LPPTRRASLGFSGRKVSGAFTVTEIEFVN